LDKLNKVATGLLTNPSSRHEPSGGHMSFDFESAVDRDPPPTSTPPAQGNDLEAIVTLLELAAIYLTTSPGAVFSFDDLIKQAQEIGGLTIAKKDARIVLDKAKFLKKQADKSYSLR
jgi:hypothetical protein